MTTGKKIMRWVEMLALFVGGPMLLWRFPQVLGGGRLFLFLGMLAALAELGSYLARDRDRIPLWNTKPIPSAMGWIVIRWVLASALLMAVFGLLAGQVLPSLPIDVPTGLFSIFHRQDAPWFLPLVIFLFYPWVSVYPQNLVYRAFFCQRYRPILGGGWALIVINAGVFSLGHVMFNNWIVLALTFVGGLIFTRTYLKHRSLLLATIEHAMYGLFCFYLGIGVFLLYGASG